MKRYIICNFKVLQRRIYFSWLIILLNFEIVREWAHVFLTELWVFIVRKRAPPSPLLAMINSPAKAALVVTLYWEFSSKVKLGWANATPPITPKESIFGEPVYPALILFVLIFWQFLPLIIPGLILSLKIEHAYEWLVIRLLKVSIYIHL